MSSARTNSDSKISNALSMEQSLPIKVLIPSPIDLSIPSNNDKHKNKSPKSQQIKNTILDWCSYSTAHGISNISRAKNKLILIVWICFYLASIIFCIYNIINIIVAFCHFNVLINMELINESPIDFPAVTVCNLNPFDKTKAQHYIDKVLTENNISYVRNLTQINIEPDLIFKLIKSYVVSDKNLTQEQKSRLGFSFNYMKLSCRFNDYTCNDTDFVMTYNFDYGNCFTFNSGRDSFNNIVPIKKISEAGSDKSFRLELYLGDEYFQSEFLLNSGARVIVHNQSITPLYQTEGRDVAAGYLTNIGIVRSFFYKLDNPYSDCVKNTHNPNSFESFYYKAIFTSLNMSLYRQKNCLPLCLQDYLKEKCNCIDGSLPYFDKNTPICNNLEKLNCIKVKKLAYFADETLTTKCYKQCPLECDSICEWFSSLVENSSNVNGDFEILDEKTNKSKILNVAKRLEGVELRATIMGPFGTINYSSLWRIFNYEHVVLILYGSEIQPFVSILKSVLYKQVNSNESNLTHKWYNSTNMLKKLDFIWINRDFYMYEWFLEFLSQIESNKKDEICNIINVKVYMTQYKTSKHIKKRKHEHDEKIEEKQEKIEAINESNSENILINSQILKLNPNMPDIERIFNAIKSEKKGHIRVLFSGPRGLGQKVDEICNKFEFDYSRQYL